MDPSAFSGLVRVLADLLSKAALHRALSLWL